MTILFIQSMGFIEWLIVLAIVFIFFSRKAGRAVGHVSATVDPQRSRTAASPAPDSADALRRYYSALELSANASPDQIRDAYRELVKVWHPDRFSEQKLKDRATEKLKEINDAYEKLCIARGIK